jgi:hypothetical protein
MAATTEKYPKGARGSLSLPTCGASSATAGTGLWTAGGSNEADIVAWGARSGRLDTPTVLAFATGSDENAFVSFVMPEDYDGGVIEVDVFYFTTATSGTAYFKGALYELDEGDNYNDAGTASTGSTATTVPSTAGEIDRQSFKFAAQTVKAGRLAVLELIRDVSEDNANADVNVIGVELTFGAGIR